MVKAVKYHIIGGGIAGLAAAKFIKEQNPDNKVTLYEAGGKLGGRCFSFEDKILGRKIDNATHVILGANRNIIQLADKLIFDGAAKFWDGEKCSHNPWRFVKHILLSVFNTSAPEVDKKALVNLCRLLFPFLPQQLKIYFSKGDLSEKLIQPLSQYVDEIKTGYCLQGYDDNGWRITALNFKTEKIRITPQEKIICALDAESYQKIFGGQKFEFNEITNIFYRTSTKLSMPEEATCLATPHNCGDWIFINNDIVGVTISDSAGLSLSDDELARKIWKEIRAIRGLLPSFLPTYRIMRYKQATIKQDKINNQKRPVSAQSEYANMVIAGDWTMKNWPCCLESAVRSAQRAVKTATDGRQPQKMLDYNKSSMELTKLRVPAATSLIDSANI